MPEAVKGQVEASFIDLELIKKYQTPFFIYNMEEIEGRIKSLKKQLGEDIKLYYAMKANPNQELLRRISRFVEGIDIASGGELRATRKVNISSEKISFTGPGKNNEELTSAVTAGVGSLSVESFKEIERVEAIAKRLQKRVNVMLRVNPIKAFQKCALRMGGGGPSPFGIDEELCGDFFKLAKNLKWCDLIGIHVYAATQVLDAEAILEYLRNTMEMVERIILDTGFRPQKINFGGGFGTPYHDFQKSLEVKNILLPFRESFSNFKKRNQLPDLIGILELGRYLVAESGLYVARIVDVKKSRGKTYCILDGGAHHHLAASGNLGQVIRQNFKIRNLSKRNDAPAEEVTIVGPLCTSIDILGEKVMIPKPEIGDYLAVLNSGAYAFTASPLLFLSHETPPELLLENNQITVIRRSLKPEEFA